MNARPLALEVVVLALAVLAGPAAVASGEGIERVAQAGPPATPAPPAPPTPPAAPADPPAPAAPASPTAPGAPAAPSLARQAVDALKELDAILARRQGAKEYLDGVRDAKPKVDKYLASDVAGDGPVRDAVRASFRYHDIVAMAVGKPTTAAEQAAIGRDPALEQCPKVKEFLAGFGKAAATPTTEEEAKNRGIAVVGFGLGAVLACAADRTAEAQKLLDAKP